jgi:hypothetical protein
MKRMLFVNPKSMYTAVGIWIMLIGQTRVMIIGIPAG